MMIRDFHSHLGRTSSGDASTPEALIKMMDKFEIEQVGVSCLSGNNMEEQNLYVYEAMKKFPGRIVGYAFINPKSKNAIDEINKNLDSRGMAGIKFHSWKHGYYPDNCPILDELFTRISGYEAHVQTHVGTSPLSTPEAWGQIAKRHPGVPVVFTHIGYYDQGFMAVELAKNTANIYIETSGQYDSWLLQKVIDEVDSNKILFGTDWPYKYHSIELEIFKYLNINKVTNDKIFCENARRLWRL
ncbi:amidohydrolase [Salmonella enterica]|nr:amidohydrolase [Salmonella enterica]EBQ2130403.1 amidohydrolase family protein [Salmonella enterica]EBT1279069.1 amidohydrolase family protein [Salmonella enterica]MIV19332.1 amidohydrolase [Salmonella enterica]